MLDRLVHRREHPAPLVRAGALELHPIVVTFAFLLGAQLAGAIGAIVAIPLAAVVQAFVVKYLEDYRAQRGWPGPEDDVGPQRRSGHDRATEWRRRGLIVWRGARRSATIATSSALGWSAWNRW